MSAAVWAEPEHYDPHERLRPIRVQGTDGASTPRPSRSSVRLLVWGVTDDDRKTAERLARADIRLRRYRIAAIVHAPEPTATTAAPALPDAVAHGAEYDCTWAAYAIDEPRPADPPETPRV